MCERCEELKLLQASRDELEARLCGLCIRVQESDVGWKELIAMCDTYSQYMDLAEKTLMMQLQHTLGAARRDIQKAQELLAKPGGAKAALEHIRLMASDVYCGTQVGGKLKDKLDGA